MPLETAAHISELVASNPASSDGLNQADDHLRLIKQVLLTDVGDALHGQSLSVIDGTSSVPSIGFQSDNTVGFFRSGAGTANFIGRLKGNGLVPIGSVHMFLANTAGNVGSGGGATAGWPYLELDGSTWQNSAYPDLAAALGQGGTTFTLPDMKTTGRFPRSRTASVAVGTTQANTVGPHTHPDVTAATGTESTNHTHPFSGTTGNDSPDHTHNSLSYLGGAGNAGGAPGGFPGGLTDVTSGASTRHQHSFSGTTGAQSVPHTHNVTVPTPANTGTTETRPEAISFVFCIKT
jgi:hypothetical protein